MKKTNQSKNAAEKINEKRSQGELEIIKKKIKKIKNKKKKRLKGKTDAVSEITAWKEDPMN